MNDPADAQRVRAEADDPDFVVSTRTAYDHSSDLYVEHLGTELSPQFETAFDLAALDSFIEDVLGSGDGRVLDVGCGPGRATSYLARRGLDVTGIDLSPAMVAAARSAHTELSFEVGMLTDLGVGNQSIAAAVYWYSIIHTPLDGLADAWVELRRALVTGGNVLLAFQTGDDEFVERPDAYGSTATLTRFHHCVESICTSLEDAGFRVTNRLVREAELPHETTPQAMVVARLD